MPIDFAHFVLYVAVGAGVAILFRAGTVASIIIQTWQEWRARRRTTNCVVTTEDFDGPSPDSFDPLYVTPDEVSMSGADYRRLVREAQGRVRLQ